MLNNTTKVVTAIIKNEKVTEIHTSALAFHVTQALQDDSKKKASDVLSSIFFDFNSWHDGLGPSKGAIEREQATQDLNDFMKSKRSTLRQKSTQLLETERSEILFSLFVL